MGKLRYKAEKKDASHYILRDQALERLQISLEEFRRLCILKGVYPRVPPTLPKSVTAHKLFYHKKDISFLQHEPVLEKFKLLRVQLKRIKKAIAKQDPVKARNLEEQKPIITLDHLVKERYPKFADALADLDDALSLLCLFSQLPSTAHVPGDLIRDCQRLYREFQLYVAHSNSLRRSFLSIKGIYFQADIKSQPVTWISPYDVIRKTEGEIDYALMVNFAEFYCVLLRFVNFKLFTDENLVYPPEIDETADRNGAFLTSFKIRGSQLSLPEAPQDETTSATRSDVAQKLATLPDTIRNIREDPEDATSTVVAESMQEDDDTPDELKALMSQDGLLFKSCFFFLNRETNKDFIAFAIQSLGGHVGWDDPTSPRVSPYDVTDSRITHEIVDRPAASSSDRNRFLTRAYVQPQYIFDCLNRQTLLPVELYAPGVFLPAHLSPFAVEQTGDYQPRDPLAPPVDEVDGASESDAASEVDEAQSMFDNELDAEVAGVSQTDFERAKKKKAARKGPVTSAEDPKPKDEEEEKQLQKVLMTSRQRRQAKLEERKKVEKQAQISSIQKKRAMLDAAEKKAKKTKHQSTKQ